MHHPLSPAAPRPDRRDLGTLLREWRATRRVSQLGLALSAGISARHLSYLETGKSHPSRDMVVRLADALGMPLRERNALLVAAGYAPLFPETELAGPALAPIRQAIGLMLGHHEPYPAFVLDRYWDIVRANRAMARLTAYLCGGSAHSNILRRVFDAQDVRACIVNWEEVAEDLIGHLHEQVAAAPADAKARALLDAVLRYPGVPSRWRTRALESPPSPLLTVRFRRGDEELRFFSTITTFATPRDVTLDEVRIESMFPADEATGARCRTLAREDASPTPDETTR